MGRKRIIIWLRRGAWPLFLSAALTILLIHDLLRAQNAEIKRMVVILATLLISLLVLPLLFFFAKARLLKKIKPRFKNRRTRPA